MSERCDWAWCHEAVEVRVTKNTSNAPPRPASAANELFFCKQHGEEFKKVSTGRTYEPIGDEERTK